MPTILFFCITIHSPDRPTVPKPGAAEESPTSHSTHTPARPHLLHVSLDARHLVEADLVDLLGRQLGGRVEAQALGVVAVAVRQRRRRQRRTRVRQVLGLDEVGCSREGRPLSDSLPATLSPLHI